MSALSDVPAGPDTTSTGTALSPVFSAAAVLRRFWPLARTDAKALWCGALLLIAAAAGETVTIQLFGRIVDRALQSGDIGAFWGPATLWYTVTALSGVLVFCGHYLVAWCGERFLLRLRDHVFRHLRNQPPGFFRRRERGDLLARLTADIESVEALVNSGAVQAVTALFSVVFFAGAALFLRWELALAAFTAVPAFLLLTRGLSHRIHARSRQERALNGEITALLEEDLANMAVVQLANRQRYEERRVHDRGVRLLRANLSIARLGALYGPLIQLTQTAGVLGVVGLGAWEISAGRITLGGVLAFAALLGSMFAPLHSLGELKVMASAASTGAARLIELLDAEPAVADPAVPRPLGRASGRLTLDGIGFRYPGAERETLQGIHLDLCPGELVALTGPSGSGKSTLAELLPRFHDPTAGAVLLDGIDLRDLALETLRRNVTLLPQETRLFGGTVRDNIGYGLAGARDAEIRAAAEAADAHGFIAALPDGYDTVIGAHGQGLSGGQRQRIALARTLLADAPVLVLDEPTTGLDAAARQRLMGPLRRAAAGRTTIVLTHDAALLAAADRVVVLTAGGVVREGTPAEPAAAESAAAGGPYGALPAADHTAG